MTVRDDRITRALAMLNAVEFSKAINCYPLTVDQRNELLAILEGEPTKDASAKSSKGKR